MSDSVATPYRTRTYLVLDNDPERPAKDGNFRSGRVLDPPLRASGSHQVDATVLADVVNRIAEGGPELRRLLIVDLRQESHAFLDGRAVSWCADKDWYFRNRQLQIFHYDLKPNPSAKRWQTPLSEIRWRKLESFRRYVFGDYAAGQPWPGFSG